MAPIEEGLRPGHRLEEEISVSTLEGDLITLQEAARRLSLKPGTLIRRRAKWAPRLGMFKIGHRWRCSAFLVEMIVTHQATCDLIVEKGGPR